MAVGPNITDLGGCAAKILIMIVGQARILGSTHDLLQRQVLDPVEHAFGLACATFALCTDWNTYEAVARTSAAFVGRFDVFDSSQPRLDVLGIDGPQRRNRKQQWVRTLNCYAAVDNRTDEVDMRAFDVVVKTRPDEIWFAPFPAEMLWYTHVAQRGYLLGKASRALWTRATEPLTSWSTHLNRCVTRTVNPFMAVAALSWGRLTPVPNASHCYCVDDQILIFGRNIVHAVFDQTAWLSTVRGIEQSADGWGWTYRRDYKQTCDCDNAYYLLHLRDMLDYAPIRPFPLAARLLHASYSLQEGSDAREAGFDVQSSSYIKDIVDETRQRLPYVSCDGNFAQVSR